MDDQNENIDAFEVAEPDFSVFRWLKAVIPPLFLGVLAFVPLSRGSMVIWLPAFIIFLVSAWHILKYGLPLLAGRTEHAGKLPRPVLAVTMFILSCVLLVMSARSADLYAGDLARELQESARIDGACPATIAGFEYDAGAGVSRTYYGRPTAQYLIVYSVSEDRQTFSIRVWHGTDDCYIFKGGVGVKLTGAWSWEADDY